MRPIEELLPHAGRMLLVDRVISHDDQMIVCESDSHRAPDHPLAENGFLSIVCGLEYGAQAMAIHGSLVATQSTTTNQPAGHGYLVAASDLRWTVKRLDRCPAPLVIEAVCEFRLGGQIAYRFELRAGGKPVLNGRASVLLAH